MKTPDGLKEHVQDLSVIEIITYGLPPDVLDTLRAEPYIDAVSVENRDQKQAVMIQSARGSEIVPDVLQRLNGHRMGKVTVREPTLEDAYVRLVGGEH